MKDIENEGVLQKTLELKPRYVLIQFIVLLTRHCSIILNPIFIAPPHGFGNSGGEEMMYSHWKTAVLQMSKNLNV